ncbi:hypothetical protein HK100_009149 [Physocladia obscura]|uniref:SHSP domain-containing protein n=1 Tax=Physocladia obscura TaxID=109957 RepID=A0AAD5T3L0_9FUNG|nr:hypothetical protein HK100_009149 [Physocladia obscura]
MNSTLTFPNVYFRDPSRDMDRLFNAQLNAIATSENDNNELASSYWGGKFNARLDMIEADDGYHIHADLPGIKKDQIDITVKDGILNISGERTNNKEIKDDQRHIVERSFGKFSRSVRLPKDADANKVAASMDNGVLQLVLGKKKNLDDGVKKITVK